MILLFAWNKIISPKLRKKRKASQREAASTLESLTLQQQVQMKKLQEHARYDQLREQEAQF
jgi:hypothetical protein